METFLPNAHQGVYLWATYPSSRKARGKLLLMQALRGCHSHEHFLNLLRGTFSQPRNLWESTAKGWQWELKILCYHLILKQMWDSEAKWNVNTCFSMRIKWKRTGKSGRWSLWISFLYSGVCPLHCLLWCHCLDDHWHPQTFFLHF